MLLIYFRVNLVVYLVQLHWAIYCNERRTIHTLLTLNVEGKKKKNEKKTHK